MFMKDIILKIVPLIICTSTLENQATQLIEDPFLVVAVLMVKNEQDAIVNTVRPLVDGGIQSFFIFDTGSTDNTIQNIENFFLETEVHYAIKQENFVDFATSRNRALDLAEKKFPEAKFLLMPDAEWYLDNASDLVTFCAKEILEETELYQILITSGVTFYTSRLFRAHRNIRFAGKIHETAIASTAKMIPSYIHFRHEPNRNGIEKSRLRYERDAAILEAEFFEDPTQPRTTFYLAQTYACLARWEDAYAFYDIRTKLAGWDEENFMAEFKKGLAAQVLYQKTEEIQWQERAIRSYLSAFEMRPWRAEPLIKLGEMFMAERNFQNAYLFLKQACEIPYPDEDILFIEADWYHYKRYDLLGICAWYVNEHHIGKEAMIKALQHEFEHPHLHRNLALHMLKLQELDTVE